MEKLRFGISSCGFQDLTEENFKELAAAGVKELELSFAEDRYDFLDFEEIKRKADLYGIHLWSFHLPFAPFSKIDITSFDEKIRDYTVKYWCGLIKKAADIGVKIMVVHPSAEPNAEQDRAAKLENARRSLKELADFAESCGAVIAVEDLPRTCLGRNSDEIKYLLASDERLRVCFDTNHLLGQQIKEFILDISDKIITTHISDYDFKNERHWLPGEGEIDWKELVETLEQTGYKGPLLYEMSLEETYSIKRRKLTFADFAENHRCLTEKKTPKPIGTPIKEMCRHWQEI